MSTPTAAELRSVVHPEGLLDRRSGEHWAGRIYMRQISLQVTRRIVGTRVTPNGLTYLMILAGIAAGAALILPGIAGPLAALVLVQLYLLLDCIDGEVARWRRQTSVTGVYLDRVGHYLSEAALLSGAGLHAAGVLDGGGFNGYATLGVVAALGAILIKSETDLVDGARAKSGLPPVQDAAAVPRSSGAASLRKIVASLKFHRLVGAVEASIFLLLAGVLDLVLDDGGLLYSRIAVTALAAIALLQTVLHLVSVLMSSRLR
ncbi:CDP-alcohol phosphatidyltransferase family protein [Streptomyces sp. SID3343]|uniref:CDP-alcohol phosphatidyltransferase family protein n=1 Tax=Streptomyces sp. SID3343 TaxID=2690260 RepID=UPI001368B6C3|nr:CDP-alcohol phosphatidyltransferase family protein [Streptomyces sp. SID3343]MYW06459.1 CDP-alcohol phosphatidyltransferase family protein [Streptomyces sp. SID3343]